jgi:hypothetical protein
MINFSSSSLSNFFLLIDARFPHFLLAVDPHNISCPGSASANQAKREREACEARAQSRRSASAKQAKRERKAGEAQREANRYADKEIPNPNPNLSG